MGGESTLSLNQGNQLPLMDGDMSDTMSLSGKLGQKGDFDRRQKKKWVYAPIYYSVTFIQLNN